MSDFRAVAAVTRTLANMLGPAVQRAAEGADVSLTFGPPDASEVSGDAAVNIFMFQVYPNPDLRNSDLPTRSGDGTVVERSECVLDLDYLISFRAGGKGEPIDRLITQRLLGAVVAALHAQPMPREDQLPSAADHGGLSTRDPLRFTPVRLDRDEMSRLWAGYLRVPYQLSVVYRCSTLLIEPMAVIRPMADVIDNRDAMPPPVGTGASTSSQPVMPPELESIRPQMLAFEPGAEVTLNGRELAGRPLAVQVGASEAELVQATASQLVFRLPAECPAGLQPVRVLLGPGDGARLDSNSLPLVIRPRLVGEPRVVERDSGDGRSVPVAVVNLSPIVQPGQRVELLLNALVPAGREAPAYRCRAEDVGSPRSLVEVPIETVRKGTYLIRVDVDGATSSLTTSPDTGRFDQPQLNLA